jgi:tetratricopeptide (TPR) repeat protein
MTDIFAIQDEIGKAISEALKVRLAPRTQTMNIDAYQNYLKGQYYRARVTPDNLAKAKGFFELALAVDPNYAPAYSGLAGYFYTLAVFGVRPTAEVSPLARSAAAKALALDPANSEAHSVLAAMAAICDYDWNASETGFRKAMAVEPVTATVRVRYAVSYLLPMGRPAEAIEESRLALETDPVSMFARFGLAWALSHAKRYQETIEYASRSLEIDANYHLIWFAIGVAQLYAGLLQEAIISLRQGVELATWWGVGIGLLAGAHYRAGDYERSQELAGKLGCLGQGVGTAIYHAATGELDAMLEALDSAYRQRDRILLDVRHLFFFGPYLVDPRFQALLQRMNLV